ncbi:hypothetical protein [Streptomyces sp. NPDC095817]|uniref:hypothetical protein n=1 Tax=Streptomyces sp. NPDC095817 TaxID=3155082 RepID=UPI003324B7D4
MTERSVIIHPPKQRAGRGVWVDGRLVGQARSLGELTTLLNKSGWPGLDEVDVAESPIIEWHGGGPEVWTPWADPWPANPSTAGAKPP